MILRMVLFLLPLLLVSPLWTIRILLVLLSKGGGNDVAVGVVVVAAHLNGGCPCPIPLLLLTTATTISSCLRRCRWWLEVS
jgi:hypothetical protein